MDSHQPAWYCIRTHHRREAIAQTSLRRIAGVEVFFPQLKWLRRNSLKTGESTESLFPNYIFARFRLTSVRDRVEKAQGVKAVVSFGHQWPTIPDAEMDELKAEFGADEVLERPTLHLAPGIELAAVTEVLKGFRSVIRYDLPVARRLQVLIDLLRRRAAPTLGRRDDGNYRLSFRPGKK